ncbi:Histone-lysine N-methyltransferase eggless [Sergentomyia squamirostris]
MSDKSSFLDVQEGIVGSSQVKDYVKVSKEIDSPLSDWEFVEKEGDGDDADGEKSQENTSVPENEFAKGEEPSTASKVYLTTSNSLDGKLDEIAAEFKENPAVKKPEEILDGVISLDEDLLEENSPKKPDETKSIEKKDDSVPLEKMELDDDPPLNDELSLQKSNAEEYSSNIEIPKVKTPSPLLDKMEIDDEILVDDAKSPREETDKVNSCNKEVQEAKSLSPLPEEMEFDHDILPDVEKSPKRKRDDENPSNEVIPEAKSSIPEEVNFGDEISLEHNEKHLKEGIDPHSLTEVILDAKSPPPFSEEMQFNEELPSDIKWDTSDDLTSKEQRQEEKPEGQNTEENSDDPTAKSFQDKVLSLIKEISVGDSSNSLEGEQQIIDLSTDEQEKTDLDVEIPDNSNQSEDEKDDSVKISGDEIVSIKSPQTKELEEEKIPPEINPKDIELPDSDEEDILESENIPEDEEESLLKSSDEDSISDSTKQKNSINSPRIEEELPQKDLPEERVVKNVEKAEDKISEYKIDSTMVEDDDDVVVIEEEETVENEKSKIEIPEDDKQLPDSVLSEEKIEKTSAPKEDDAEEAKELSSATLDKSSEDQCEAESRTDDEVIEIPEDEPSQDHTEGQKPEEVPMETKDDPVSKNPVKESIPSTENDVNDADSSMSVDLMESNDIPSDRGETGEDDSRPIDMEVDDTANAEWPVNNFQKDQPEPEKRTEEQNSNEKTKRHDCLNLACKGKSDDFSPAQGFVVTYFSSKKRKKTQYICRDCYEIAMTEMLQYCNVLENHAPLFHYFPQHKEVVEISDSSEDSSHEDEVIQSFKRPMSEQTRDVIENNLDRIITSTMQRVKITQQFEWTKKDLEKRCNNLTKAHDDLTVEFNEVQRIADNMFQNLNSREKRATQCEAPINIFTEFPAPEDEHGQTNFRLIRERSTTTPSLVSTSQHTRQTTPALAAAAPLPNTRVPEIQVGTTYYGMRTHLTKPWVFCTVLDKLQGDSDTRYRVKFMRQAQSDEPNQEGILTGKQLAFIEAPTLKINVGTRILAMYSAARRRHFYPGIVAEPTQETNKFRYLIFFDDGYVQYVNPEDIRRICQVSENVWEDVHPSSRDFIKSYLQENHYQRAVAQVKIGQKIEVEREGKWVSMRVAKVDCSLILVYHAEYTEWIYSGSQRLLPIYRMKMDSRLSTGKKLQTRNEPYVSFRHVLDDSQRAAEDQHAEQEKESTVNRSVAKKSTAQPAPQPPQPMPQAKQLMNNSTIFLEDDDNRPKGKVVFYTAKFNMPPKSYTPHSCNAECLYRISYDLSLYNPLAKPLLSGWERKIYRVKTRRYVIYKAPCGRSLRDITEIHRYLRLTDCALNVDSFDFEPAVHCLAEYVIESAIIRKSDISNGVESMPIASVNCYDETVPPSCIYANHRIPTDGVHLNLDPDFLVGCDCEDDCMDKSKCSCWQLTIAGVKYLSPNVDIDTVGYSHMKLHDPVPTGIYECNSRCKCRKNCLNRVVQHPLSLKLQVFKTANRGWGLRCLNDVPKGQFICIYAGHLLTEQKANEGGQNHGDEYFAELDYIEVAEGMKEGYEPGTVEEESASDRDDDEYDPKRRRDSDSDEEFRSNTSVLQKTIKTRSRTRGRGAEQPSKVGSSDTGKSQAKDGEKNEDVIAISDDDDDRIPQSFVPNISIEKELIPSTKNRSLRRMFGKNEDVYVMDAKIMGNVGRYFNHSCSPNLFVQNVFVDTHDLRFPWVSFFAICHIRAGTELTWNYNYDVGTVPGKFLFCQCGSKNCRGRIL